MNLSQAELEEWGCAIGEAAVGGATPLTLALRGPLGAGKSVLARAVARGAGVRRAMPSPTFNLRFTYEGDAGVSVHHLDLYRLDDPDDVWELGWRELGGARDVVMIEWPGRAEALLPATRWDIALDFVGDADPNGRSGADLRTVELTRRGDAPALPSFEPARPPGRA